jgi:antitoxin ParD1/3/4
MALKTTSISLDEHSEEFIRQQVASGRYATAGEVVCDALRLLEAEMRREAVVSQALREGEESGFEEGDLFGDVRKGMGL